MTLAQGQLTKLARKREEEEILWCRASDAAPRVAGDGAAVPVGCGRDPEPTAPLPFYTRDAQRGTPRALQDFRGNANERKRVQKDKQLLGCGLQALPAPIPLCCTCCHPSRGLGCSKQMGTESGRNMWLNGKQQHTQA